MPSGKELPSTLKQLYADPLLFEQEYAAVNDIPFWESFVGENRVRSLLELGSGTGRIARHIAPLLQSYTGIDLSQPFLDKFQQLNPGLLENPANTVLRADMTDFDLGRQFDAVIVPYNTITHLYTIDQMHRMLHCVEKHLRPGSFFCIDYFNPDIPYLSAPSPEQPYDTFTHKATGERYTIYESHRYDAASQIDHIERRYLNESTGVQTVRHLPMRVFFPQELDALLLARFRILHKYGNYDKTPFESASPKQLIVAAL